MKSGIAQIALTIHFHFEWILIQWKDLDWVPFVAYEEVWGNLASWKEIILSQESKRVNHFTLPAVLGSRAALDVHNSTLDSLTTRMDVGPGPQDYPHFQGHSGSHWAQHIVVVNA